MIMTYLVVRSTDCINVDFRYAEVDNSMYIPYFGVYVYLLYTAKAQ